MAFWTSVKRAFGFSPEEDDMDEEYDSSLPTYAADSPAAATHAPEEAQAPATDETGPAPQPAPDDSVAENTAGDPDLPGDLFDAVIKLFNDTLPDFVKDCLSTDRQRQFIYNALDESLRTRLDNAVAGADRSQIQKLRNERDSLLGQIEEMQADSGRADSLAQEIKRVQLSADRQKRALCDRVNDLESQVTTLQSEKERILTRRHASAEIQELKKDIATRDEEITSLKGQIEELSSREIPDPQPAPDNSEEIERLQAEVERQTTLREQLEMKVKMTDAMMNELRSQTAEARQELAKAQEGMAVVNEIQAQLDKFEDVKKRKDERIAELQDALRAMTGERDDIASRLEKATADNESLRRTIENNLYNQANSENRLRREIKELRQQLETSAPGNITVETSQQPVQQPAQQAPAPKRRSRRKPRVDENLDNTDWLAAPSKKADADFGYHEPPHSPINTNDAQLSLF
ncbi:MAG: hypothetical protein K2M02_10625 [Duncaniella sp.]|nr:hypothetical protein [Duncaniella sp.]